MPQSPDFSEPGWCELDPFVRAWSGRGWNARLQAAVGAAWIGDPSVDALILTALDEPSIARLRELVGGALGAILTPIGAGDVVVLREGGESLASAPVDRRALQDLLIRRAESGRRVVWAAHPSADHDVLDASLPLLAPEAAKDWPGFAERVDEAVRTRLQRPASRADAVAFAAGILQMHDCLDASHARSQSIEGTGRHSAGDYWHAIMHRREPDYGNSKYWFRHVGSAHPVYSDLALRAAQILDACRDPDAAVWRQRVIRVVDWDPYAFVDLCQAVSKNESWPLAVAVRQIQWVEMSLLLSSTWQDAAGR